jgi:hypothetical protein
MDGVKNWFKGLSGAGQITVTSVAVLLGLGTIGAVASPAEPTPSSSVVESVNQADTKEREPVITYKKESVTAAIPYKTKEMDDNSMDKGTEATHTDGVDGVRTKTYRITLTDGVETGRKLIGSKVTKKPVTEVIAVGTYVEPKASCDSNYSGACVPIASDVDCASGSGDGPGYVYSTVTVTGYDIYDLDGDGDGYGCE